MAGGYQWSPEEVSTPRGRTESGDQENKYHKSEQHDDEKRNTTLEGGNNLITSWQQEQILEQDGGKICNKEEEQDNKIAREIIGLEVSTQQLQTPTVNQGEDIKQNLGEYVEQHGETSHSDTNIRRCLKWRWKTPLITLGWT